MSKESYVVTINLATELDDEDNNTLKKIVNNYVQAMEAKNYPYIYRYEYGKENKKLHCHIAYKPDVMPKNTSNETRKYRSCYEDYFYKKDYPRSVDHRAFDVWEKAIGYVAKDTSTQVDYKGGESGITEQEISDAIEQYNKRPIKKERSKYTINMFVEDFIVYKKEKLKEKQEDYTNEYLVEYMRTKKCIEKLNYTIFTKLKFGRFKEYVDYKAEGIINISLDIKCNGTYVHGEKYKDFI